MSTYLISYEVRNQRDTSHIEEAIKAFGTWAHITDQTWAIVTDKSAIAVRDGLMPLFQIGERLFVVRSGTEAAWKGVISSSEWLKKYL